jgi:hypothetical protein
LLAYCPHNVSAFVPCIAAPVLMYVQPLRRAAQQQCVLFFFSRRSVTDLL